MAVPRIDLTNPEFNTVLDLVESTNQSLFLTGKAGTGKSSLLRYITATTKKKYVVLAPTGIAAVNVGGQTMHSFFRIPTKPLLPNDPDLSVHRLRAFLKYPKSHIKLLKSLDMIIIDEISMVRADIIDFIDKVLRVFTGNMRLPFGGKQMFFVGDVFQLEPVVTANDRDVLSHCYSSFYFFNALVFSRITLVPIELNKVYRQDDPVFISILDNIRLGIPDRNNIEMLNSRRVEVPSDGKSSEFTMTIATRRDLVDAINERHLRALPTPSVIFHGEIEGDFPTTSLPTDLNLELKVGAQVVFIKNDAEKRWVNGTLAVVETCLPDCVTVRTEDGEEHNVEIERWNNVRYVYNEKTHRVDTIELGAFMQYPLKPAWALTIHKSQGLTFGKVIVDMGGGAFAGGQTYVALSRCRSLEGITLVNPISPHDIYIKNEIARFAASFNNPQLIDDAMQRSRADALFKSAAADFDAGNYPNAISRFAQAVALRPEILSHDNVRRLIAIKSRRLTALQDSIVALNVKLDENSKRFESIADNYVKTADELSGDGWETDAAIAQYDKALNISPDYAPALLGKARALGRIGKTDDAYALYRKISERPGPMAWYGFMGMAEIADSEGDTFNAINNCMKAVDSAPRQPEPLRLLVGLYEAIGDIDSAAAYAKKLQRLLRRPGKRNA